MRLMRKRNPQLQEDGFYFLLPHAGEHVEQLMNEFSQETDHGLCCWLLELIGEARSPQALPLFLEHLNGDDRSLQYWAIYGLKKLNTKEARRILWEAGVSQKMETN
jgi:hypothetical protein